MWAILAAPAVASKPLIPHVTQALGKAPRPLPSSSLGPDAAPGSLLLLPQQLDQVLAWMQKNTSPVKADVKLSLSATKKMAGLGGTRQTTGSTTHASQSKSITYTVTVTNNGTVTVVDAEVLLITECEWQWDLGRGRDGKGASPRVFSSVKKIPSLTPKKRFQLDLDPLLLNKHDQSSQNRYSNSNNTYGTKGEYELRLKRAFVVVMDGGGKTLLVQPVD